MDIFVGNLPPDTSVVDLRRLFGNAATSARFRLCRRTNGDGGVCCHGWATLPAASLGRDLIASLDGTHLQGYRLQVREFVHRNQANERRARRWRGAPWTGLERRRGERRRNR